MVAFKDFVPQQIRKQGFIKPRLWETVAQAVAAANEWIREQEVMVISVETVVAPDLYGKKARSDSGMLTGMNGSAPGSSQLVRVWYRAE